ncbi:MAG: polysaccharide biosynthesis protein [Prevotella sp.]|nr:polysaccharide biosynthesis protein [Prevotella sp.]
MSDFTQTYNHTEGKNKRIASNTILLFLRMFILTLINLYAVRIVLRRLGEEDYGVFNTVAGVVMATSFLSGVLAFSVQRFLSFYLGKHDAQSLRKIFSLSLNIVVILSIVVFIILETVGLWFVNTQLTIPTERMQAMRWAYQFGIFGLLCSFIQIPFTAAMFAHEDMGNYTIVSTLECLLRLLAAYLIGIAAIDNLVFYSSGIFVSATIIMLLYIGIGHLKYNECHYKYVKDKKLCKEILFFSGWALYGSASNMGMIQGSTILINVFFGSIVTAAFAIALQIYNAFNSLCNSMVLAFRPPMIKAYAEGNAAYLRQLFSVSNKFLLYILAAIAIPLICEMPTILEIWLHEVSPNIVLFARLMIVYIVCISMNNPISIIMHASGHIKQYNLPVETITLMCLPITWLLFRLGFPAYYVFISMIGVCLVAHVVRLWCLKRYHRSFSIRSYMTSLVIPSAVVLSVGACCAWGLHAYVPNMVWRLVTVVIFTPLVVLSLAYCFGTTRQEKGVFVSLIHSIRNHT